MMQESTSLKLGQFLEHIQSHIGPNKELLLSKIDTTYQQFSPNHYYERQVWSTKLCFFLDNLEEESCFLKQYTYFASILVVPKGFDVSRLNNNNSCKSRKNPFLTVPFKNSNHCDLCKYKSNVKVEICRDGILLPRMINIEIKQIIEYNVYVANGFLDINNKQNYITLFFSDMVSKISIVWTGFVIFILFFLLSVMIITFCLVYQRIEKKSEEEEGEKEEEQNVLSGLTVVACSALIPLILFK